MDYLKIGALRLVVCWAVIVGLGVWRALS